MFLGNTPEKLAMASDDAVWEWAVAGIGDISVGESIVGGVQAYHFMSRLARYGAIYLLIEVGLGFEPPWKQFKRAVESVKKFKALNKLGKVFNNKTFQYFGDSPYTVFFTAGAFSGDDLNGAIGQSYSAGAAVVGGYQLQAISATKVNIPFGIVTGNSGNLFRFVNVSGPTAGLDLNISIKSGLWLRLYETVYSGWVPQA